MQVRAGVIFPWLLIGTFAIVVSASALLAERSGSLYGFVATMIVSGALLVVIHLRCSLDWRVVLTVALVLRASVFWLEPSLSDDAYRYVWDGRIQQSGINPYSFRPSELDLSRSRSPELYERLNSREVYTVYPPLSQAVFYLGALVYVNDWRTTYYGIKLIILLIELVGVWLLVRLVEPALAILYAWNPLVIIEVAGQGHTEGMAAALLVVALFLARENRYGWASAAVAAAGMVKLYPFILLPLFWRRGRWIAALASLAATAMLAAPYAEANVIPHLVESLTLYVRYFEFNAGPYYAVKGLFQIAAGQDFSKILGPLFAVAFLLALPLLYHSDRIRHWSLERSILVILGVFLLLSTTIHPWYTVPLLVMVAVQRPVRWHWYWFGLISMGTYLLYVGGPYWLFVILAWSIWAVLAGRHHFDSALQWVQKRRGAAKFRAIEDWLRPHSGPIALLDLGAAEGYVGLEASKRMEGTVVLADIVNMNRTSLPFFRVDEDRLGFETDSFDYVILYYVLHHSVYPDRVLKDAARVARRGVIVVESVFEYGLQHRVLAMLDRLANRIRSGGVMRPQEKNLQFRTMSEWVDFIEGIGLSVQRERTGGNWIHTKGMILVRT